MIVIQAVAIALALAVLIAMAVGPELHEWHERTPAWQPDTETATGGAYRGASA